MEPIEINAGSWYLRALRADERVDDYWPLERDAVLEDPSGVAQPVGDDLQRLAHREHAVRHDVRQAGQSGHVVAPVDRVGIARHAGVVDEISTGQSDDALGQFVADGDVLEPTERHASSHP